MKCCYPNEKTNATQEGAGLRKIGMRGGPVMSQSTMLPSGTGNRSMSHMSSMNPSKKG